MLFLVIFSISLTLTGAVYYFGLMSTEKANEAVLAKQASHSRPTSRLGGVASLIPIFIGVFFIDSYIVYSLILSSGIIFLAGLLEDLGYKIKPVIRLLCAVISGFFAILFTGIFLRDVDLTIASLVLSFTPIAIFFTAFCSAGVSHSFNLIDGLNGLASGIIIIISGGLYFVATSVSELELARLCLLIIVCVFAFFLWNFPKGLIFLGDAGAYTFGHILAWVAIILIHRHPEISAWAILCIFFWPLMDTFLAIYRRYTKQASIDQPDRMHYHHVIMRGLILLSRNRLNSEIANPLATVLIFPFCICTVLSGVIFLLDNKLSIIFTMIFSMLFIVIYTFFVYLLRSKNYKKS